MLYATISYSKKNKFFQKAEEINNQETIQLFVSPKSFSKFGYDSKRIIKSLKRKRIKVAFLKGELSQNELLIQYLRENQIYVITGYRLFKALLPCIVKDLCNQMELPQEKIRLLLYTDEYSIENRELIQLLSQNVKQLTVVSKQYKKYQKQVVNLYEQYGYIIKLYAENEYLPKKENIIIHLNREESELQKIELNPNSIYISFLHHPSWISPYWNGISISDFIIKGPDIMEEANNQMATCEAKIYNVLKTLKENESIFLDNQYQITGYWGKNGKIDKESFRQLGKNYT